MLERLGARAHHPLAVRVAQPDDAVLQEQRPWPARGVQGAQSRRKVRTNFTRPDHCPEHGDATFAGPAFSHSLANLPRVALRHPTWTHICKKVGPMAPDSAAVLEQHRRTCPWFASAAQQNTSAPRNGSTPSKTRGGTKGASV